MNDPYPLLVETGDLRICSYDGDDKKFLGKLMVVKEFEADHEDRFPVWKLEIIGTGEKVSFWEGHIGQLVERKYQDSYEVCE